MNCRHDEVQSELCLFRASGAAWGPNLQRFGVCWLLLSCAYSHYFSWMTVLPIPAVAGLLHSQLGNCDVVIPYLC